jgi:hypothetical protein
MSPRWLEHAKLQECKPWRHIFGSIPRNLKAWTNVYGPAGTITPRIIWPVLGPPAITPLRCSITTCMLSWVLVAVSPSGQWHVTHLLFHYKNGVSYFSKYTLQSLRIGIALQTYYYNKQRNEIPSSNDDWTSVLRQLITGAPYWAQNKLVLVAKA